MGSPKVTVKFKNDSKALAKIHRNILEGMYELGFDIAAQARRNAPVVTSALRNSIHVLQLNEVNQVQIVAGGIVAPSSKGAKYVDYAMKRELGPNRNPSTEHYMENAMNTLMGSGDYIVKYFGDIAK